MDIVEFISSLIEALLYGLGPSDSWGLAKEAMRRRKYARFFRAEKDALKDGARDIQWRLIPKVITAAADGNWRYVEEVQKELDSFWTEHRGDETMVSEFREAYRDFKKIMERIPKPK